MTAPHLFVSYSHRDKRFVDELRTHLTPLQKQFGVEIWSDQDIALGSLWKAEIDAALAKTNIAVLLVTASYLTSKWITEVELPALLEREAKGEVKIIPVILRPCHWYWAPLAHLQVLPRNGKALAELTKTRRSRAWADLAKEIEASLHLLTSTRGAPARPDARRSSAERGRNPDMNLKNIAKDYVTVEKPDGTQIPGVQAHVQPSLILIPDANVPLEEGDFITRRLRSGIDELFEVVDRGFYDVGHGMDAHFQAKVKRVKEKRLIQSAGGIDKRMVFVVHGRNEKARSAVVAFLRAVDLRPIEWSEAVKITGEASPFVGRVVEAGFGAAQAVIILLTGDDLAKLRPELQTPTDPIYEKKATPQARANVLFEAGFAFGRHPERTVILEFGQLRPFSDVQGRHVIRMGNSSQKRHELVERLRTAGCTVNTSGADWHTAGDFESA
jgi:predicted nucleotide-binding protein